MARRTPDQKDITIFGHTSRKSGPRVEGSSYLAHGDLSTSGKNVGLQDAHKNMAKPDSVVEAPAGTRYPVQVSTSPRRANLTIELDRAYSIESVSGAKVVKRKDGTKVVTVRGQQPFEVKAEAGAGFGNDGTTQHVRIDRRKK